MEDVLDKQLLVEPRLKPKERSLDANERPESGLMNTFLGGMGTAQCLMASNSFVEARKVLSHTFGLVRKVLEAQEPCAMNYIMDVLITLQRAERDADTEVLDMLRSYASRMADIVLPQNQ